MNTTTMKDIAAKLIKDIRTTDERSMLYELDDAVRTMCEWEILDDFYCALIRSEITKRRMEI